MARLRALQEQAQDKMAERHALEARRQQDELERQVFIRFRPLVYVCVVL